MALSAALSVVNVCVTSTSDPNLTTSPASPARMLPKKAEKPDFMSANATG